MELLLDWKEVLPKRGPYPPINHNSSSNRILISKQLNITDYRQTRSELQLDSIFNGDVNDRGKPYQMKSC